MRGEIWKDIKGYKGKYQISNFGRVRALVKWDVNKRKFVKHIKILKPTDNGYGYLIISLKDRGVKKNQYIHRLVAEHFIDNKRKCPEVNHIDYDKYNNRVSNLEWCTRRENVRHSIPNMRCRRKKSKTNTGERYISFIKGKGHYRITVDCKQYGATLTLEEAIKVRDEILEKKGVV